MAAIRVYLSPGFSFSSTVIITLFFKSRTSDLYFVSNVLSVIFSIKIVSVFKHSKCLSVYVIVTLFL